VNNVLNGEIVLLENTRYEDFPKKLESSCDEALSKYWASFGDIFVLEAFGSAHRCHASTYGISKYLPSYAGFLVEKETEILNEVLNSSRTLIMGGSKIDEKIAVIDNLVPTSDALLIGGGMCFTFLKALGYNIGKSLLAEEQIDYVKDLLAKYGNKIVLPVDVVTQNGVKNINELNDDDIGYDIGPKSVEMFKEVLANSNMVLWNGPLGMYEEDAYANGTKDVLEFLEQQDFKTILGGGNIVDAATKFGVSVHHKCTGGGSTLEYLGGARFKTLSRLKGDK
jgi:phosphoglycerate kinase